MTSLTPASMATFWSANALGINLIIVLNLAGALLLGFVVGYERAYRGRAAGMRTYGLVCMASTAVTCVVGYPASWYGGGHLFTGSGDPTRVIQGILTGVGFLCAGVITKDGLNINGLTTAASIWACSAIGILVGLGIYAAAILLALLTMLSMILVSRLEHWLPSHPAIDVVLRFSKDFKPDEQVLRQTALARGYDFSASSLSITYQDGKPEWHFIATVRDKTRGVSLSMLAEELSFFEGIESFSMAHARN